MSASMVLSIRLSSFLSSSIVGIVGELVWRLPNPSFLLASHNPFAFLPSTTMTLPGKTASDKKLEDGF